MWIFLTNAFYSISEDMISPDHLVVRARLPGDIEMYFPDAEIQENAGTDYRYRASIPRILVADAIRERILQIDYQDFHGSADSHRKSHLSAVFNTMKNSQAWQEILESTND